MTYSPFLFSNERFVVAPTVICLQTAKLAINNQQFMSLSLCLFELNLQGLWGRLCRGRRAAASAPAGPIQPGERRFGAFCPPLSATPLIGSVAPLRSAPFRLNADCARRVLYSPIALSTLQYIRSAPFALNGDCARRVLYCTLHLQYSCPVAVGPHKYF